jgi:sulfite reductase (NADPH) flavoprotein alpha-component
MIPSVFELLHKNSIRSLPERVVAKYAAHVQQEIPIIKSSLLDLLHRYPVKDAAHFEIFLQQLEPTTPRLYSIASSLESLDGEVHLTVARDAFSIEEELKYGLCSDLLCSLNPAISSIFIFTTTIVRYRTSISEDVIAIGPGNRHCSFPCISESKENLRAGGRNWLF